MINGITPQTATYQTSKTSTNTPATGESSTAKQSNTTVEDELQTTEFNDTEEVLAGTTEEEQAIDEVNNQLAKAEKQYEGKVESCNKQIEQMQKQLEEIEQQRQSLLNQLFAGSETATIMASIQQLNEQKASINNNITSILFNIKEFETALEENRINAQESIDKINDAISQKNTLQDVQSALTNTSQQITPGMGMGDVVATLGNSFVGVINDDKAGNAAFSNGVSQHWCADFVTSIVKMACESTGKSVPAGFGSSSVSGLQSWANSNGSFIQTYGKSNKASIISGSIKIGDIMIQKQNGASHTGIVTKVYPDGSFDTVEGNSSDAVKNRHYTPDEASLTGFISMKYN